MRKQIRKLSLHRETLVQLNAGELVQVAGGDQEPPYTIKEWPTKGCASIWAC